MLLNDERVSIEVRRRLTKPQNISLQISKVAPVGTDKGIGDLFRDAKRGGASAASISSSVSPEIETKEHTSGATRKTPNARCTPAFFMIQIFFGTMLEERVPNA